MPQHVRVAIIGTGFAGLGMAIRLKQAGMEDFVLLERADDVGGTWRDNTYPGLSCDVPSHLYSFSFALNPDWTRSFSPGQEIWDYLRRCVERYGLGPHIRFGHEVCTARWHDSDTRWIIETTRGDLTADILVSGTGALSAPRVPALPGLDQFEGTRFHSAEWDHDHDLRGERVAVVGTGASAVQLVPEIQPRVGKLYLFQRTPAWVIPRRDRAFSRFERWMYRVFPALHRVVRGALYWTRESLVLGFTVRPDLMRVAERLARRHLARQIRDPGLRAKLTPDYRMGCKRILLSDNFYPILTRPNVEVVTDRIKEIGPTWIGAAEGRRHEVDTIIFATGFRVTDNPVSSRVVGRGGIRLADAWRDGMEAYRGTTIAGFPNFFMLVGPNTGLGHTSMVVMIESQITYVMDCLRFMERYEAKVVEIRPDAQRAFNDGLQGRMRRTVWLTGGCASWYLDSRGRNTTLWPASSWRFRRDTRRFDAPSYAVRAAHPEGVSAQGGGRGPARHPA